MDKTTKKTKMRVNGPQMMTEAAKECRYLALGLGMTMSYLTKAVNRAIKLNDPVLLEAFRDCHFIDENNDLTY